MARIDRADLRVDGNGRNAVFTVDLKIDWGRGDDGLTFEVLIRFKGADTGLRGSDDVIKIHAFTTTRADGDRRVVQVDNADGSFDEDRGGKDEVYAEVEIHEVAQDQRAVRTNKVKGAF